MNDIPGRSLPTAAIIGGGVIGSGWATRFLLNGWNVRFFDPSEDAERVLHAVIARGRAAMPALCDVVPEEGTLTIASSTADAVVGALYIQESTPERIEVKRAVLRSIQEACEGDAIIASSTSGFMPSELQEESLRPEQIIVSHPYNPVYLLPIVEVVGSDRVSKDLIDRASRYLASVSMKPVVLGAEVPAHVGDRLLEALWREALWLVKDGVATTGQIDDIITHSFGLRWAQKGLFETYRVAGGQAGMKHFLEQFGPCLEWPWTKLMDVPDLNEELIDRIVEQSDEQAAGRTVMQLEDERDRNLVALLKALREEDAAAGAFLNEVNKRLEGEG
jgi:carnitine 3-dehydrogenase